MQAHRRLKSLLSAAIVVLAICVLGMKSDSLAQEQGVFEHAVKFICGRGDGKILAKGDYLTAINIHNPANREIKFLKKFAIALPREKPGRVSKFVRTGLGPDQAFEIDCEDIRRHLESKERFIKGFAIIRSDFALDVVAVYTAAATSGSVQTLDVEHVLPR